MMYPSRPSELLVINELSEPRHRASRIRSILISGLEKTSIPDDCNDIGELNQLPFRVAVTLFSDSAEDLKIINALEKIPPQRRQDWIRQCLVSGLSGIGRSNTQSNPIYTNMEISKNATDERLPKNKIIDVKIRDAVIDQMATTELDVDLDKLEQQRELYNSNAAPVDDYDLSALNGLFK